MNAHDRREFLLSYLQKNNVGYISELCNELDVSAMTIRRDFAAMAKQGTVTIIHGGATINHGNAVVQNLNARQVKYPLEKQRIAEYCASLVPEGATVFIDASSTTERIADCLKKRQNLTVLTCSLNVGNILAQNPNITLIMVPGTYRHRVQAISGQMTVEFLNRFYLDYLFMGCAGIDVEHGLTCPDYVDAETKRAILKNCRHIIIPADHSKLGRSSFDRITPLSNIEMIVTDKKADREIISELENHVKVQLV